MVPNQSVNPSKNQIQAEISTASDRCFAVAATGTSPTPSTIHVYPDGLWTIQDAIDQIDPGGTVVVHPGVYRENIHFSGKDLVLRSTDPDDPDIRAATILDGGGGGTEFAGSVVRFAGTETAACVLEGFTIQHGGADCGGGVNGATEQGHTLATIRKNVIWDNIAWTAGGGIARCDGLIRQNVIAENRVAFFGAGLGQCCGLIERNDIRDNYSYSSGGGLADCSGADCRIQNNVVYRNVASGEVLASAACGGGLYQCNARIVNNTIWANGAADSPYGNGQGGGLALCEGAHAEITNNIVWENSASTGAQLDNSETPNYCCIQDWSGGGAGNITAEPDGPKMLFPGYGNFRLETGSPCVDAGATISGLTEDWEGDSRPYNGDFDIGADENLGQTLPDPVTNFTVVPDDYNIGDVQFSWTPVPGADGYYLYLANRPHGPYRRTAEDLLTGSTALLTNVTSGPNYYWIITAVRTAINATSESLASLFVRGTPLRILAIDAGHGGGDPGNQEKVKDETLNECDLTWDLAVLVERTLWFWPNRETLRMVPLMTTGHLTSPTQEDVAVRAAWCRNLYPKIVALVSIHFNDYPNNPNRMLTFVHPDDKSGDQLNFSPDHDYSQLLLEKAQWGYNCMLDADDKVSDARVEENREMRLIMDSAIYGLDTAGKTRAPSGVTSLIEVNFMGNEHFQKVWPRSINDGFWVKYFTAWGIADAMVAQLPE